MLTGLDPHAIADDLTSSSPRDWHLLLNLKLEYDKSGQFFRAVFENLSVGDFVDNVGRKWPGQEHELAMLTCVIGSSEMANREEIVEAFAPVVEEACRRRTSETSRLLNSLSIIHSERARDLARELDIDLADFTKDEDDTPNEDEMENLRKYFKALDKSGDDYLVLDALESFEHTE